MAWTFSGKDDVPLAVIADAARWLKTYQEMMAETIAAATNGGLSKDRILEMMLSGTTLTPTDAKACGLAEDVVEAAIPADARWCRGHRRLEPVPLRGRSLSGLQSSS